MFFSWSNNNKITTKSLQIQYTGAYTKTYRGYRVYEFHRIATKEYQYVGMTEAAAKACQDAKLAQYTRKFIQWYNENGYYGKYREFRCVADVTMNSDGDGLWTVSISVNEDQQQYYRALDVNYIPYDLFDLGLDYDEEPATDGFLRIYSVWRQNNRLYVAYQQGISGFDRANLHGQNSTDGGLTWTTIQPTGYSTEGYAYFNSGAWADGLVRLQYGTTPIISNSEQTPEYVYSMTLDLYNPYWQVVGVDEGAWRVQFAEDFPDFDPTKLGIDVKQTYNGTWYAIQDQCDVVGDRIVTPYTEKDTLFWMEIHYQGHTPAPVNNLFNFLVVDSNLEVTVDNNQVDAVVVSFVNRFGEDFDPTQVSIGYRDDYTSRTYSGNQVTVTQDEEGNCTATIHVGNLINGSSMIVSATLKYWGSNVSTIEKRVYRTS